MDSRSPESRLDREEVANAYGDIPSDSKPLAAYRLGRTCFGLWMWHKLFWAMPEHESTWNGIPLSVEHLRRDRLVLADEIHQNVFNELPRVLDELGHVAAVLTEAWCQGGEYGGFEFGSRVVPGRAEWDELRILLARSLAPDHPLRGTFELGLAVGEYLLNLSDYGSESVRPSEDGVSPDILPLVRAAIKIPNYVLSGIPRLASLVAFCGHLQDQNRAINLADFFEQNPGASKLYRSGDIVSVLIFRNFFDNIDASIENALGAMRGPTAPPKPDWNASRDRCVRYNGVIVKRIKRRGTDIERVLDAFQGAGWPESILNPFVGDTNLTNEKPYELVDSLNERLVEIRFHVEEGGRRIAWGPVSPR